MILCIRACAERDDWRLLIMGAVHFGKVNAGCVRQKYVCDDQIVFSFLYCRHCGRCVAGTRNDKTLIFELFFEHEPVECVIFNEKQEKTLQRNEYRRSGGVVCLIRRF